MFPTFPYDVSLCNFDLPFFASGVSNAVATSVPFHATPAFDTATHGLTLAETYSAIATKTRQRMRAMQATELTVAKEYCARTSTNGKFELTGEAWQIQSSGKPIAELRLVKIDGAKSNIINAWIFPAQPTHAPVFAAELIGVNDVTRVAFIDIQTPAADPLIRQRVQHKTKPIAERFAMLPCDEAAPTWATCDSAGYFTYSRGAGQAETERISECYFGYLDCYLNECLGDARAKLPKAVDTVHEQAVARLAAYQLHHMEHSPGKKFLGNLFGHEWTHEFMTNFLFAKLETQG